MLTEKQTAMGEVTLSDIQDSYSINQIASLLSLHYMTVRGWVCDGKLQGYKLGRRWYVLRRDLDAFINISAGGQQCN